MNEGLDDVVEGCGPHQVEALQKARNIGVELDCRDGVDHRQDAAEYGERLMLAIGFGFETALDRLNRKRAGGSELRISGNAFEQWLDGVVAEILSNVVDRLLIKRRLSPRAPVEFRQYKLRRHARPEAGSRRSVFSI